MNSVEGSSGLDSETGITDSTPSSVPTPRRKWLTVRWTRVSTLLALCIVLPMLAMWFLEPWYFAREMGRGNTRLSVTPSSLRDKSSSPLASTRLQAFEFSFQVPWARVDIRKDFKSGSIFKFAGGPNLMVSDPRGMTDLSNSLRNQSKPRESVFGSRALSSNYDFMAAELAATPDQIH
ncbi:MAG TPA: hypothetical protein VGJ21_15775, partial [Terracidiphilus sp.]